MLFFGLKSYAIDLTMVISAGRHRLPAFFALRSLATTFILFAPPKLGVDD
jgi:hypothetical protein